MGCYGGWYGYGDYMAAPAYAPSMNPMTAITFPVKDLTGRFYCRRFFTASLVYRLPFMFHRYTREKKQALPACIKPLFPLLLRRLSSP